MTLEALMISFMRGTPRVICGGPLGVKEGMLVCLSKPDVAWSIMNG